MKVYLLEHMYEYGENAEHEETKRIGIYSSREMAEKTLEKYLTLPGFMDYSPECFYISEIELDKNHWEEGFFSYSY